VGLQECHRHEFLTLTLNRRILMQIGCFLYSSPKGGLNGVPTVKITVGMPFPGVPTRNNPWSEYRLVKPLGVSVSPLDSHCNVEWRLVAAEGGCLCVDRC